MNHLMRRLEAGKRGLRSARGFSLVELAVVIVVIGVLVAIAVPVFNSVQDGARKAVVSAAATNGAKVLASELALGLGSGGTGSIAPATVRVASGPLSDDVFSALNTDDVRVGLCPDVTWDELSLVNFCVQGEGWGIVAQTGPSGEVTIIDERAPDVVEEEESGDPKFVVTLDTGFPECNWLGVSVTNTSGGEIIAEWPGGSAPVGSDVTLIPAGPTGEFQVTFTGSGASFSRTPAPAMAGCLKSVDRWDAGFTSSAKAAFSRAVNLTSVVTPPAGITDMSQMFDGATSFNQAVNDWDTSQVKDMSAMFRKANVFNQDLNGWDVSQVTSMRSMFEDAWAFNRPLDRWNVGNVTDMSSMFFLAKAFNQPLNSWDVREVVTMERMFYTTLSFNGEIGDWKTEKLRNTREMFNSAVSFDRDISGWDVSEVTDMQSMFSFSQAFNQPLAGWDVSSVTNMGSMFFGAQAFNQNVSGWAVDAVTSFSSFWQSSALTASNVPSKFR